MSYLDRFKRFAEGAGIGFAVSLHGDVLHFYFAASKFPFLLAIKFVKRTSQ